MKGYLLLLSLATVTGCDYFPLGLPGADAGSALDASVLDASTDAGDSGLVRDGGIPGDIDGGGGAVDELDAAVTPDAAADAGDHHALEDSGVAEDGGAASAACDAPAWILARCGVHEPPRRGVVALLPSALSADQVGCVERWLATLEP